MKELANLADKSDRTRAKRLNHWQRNFLKVLREVPNVKAACEAARISRDTAYTHRRNNPFFAQQWADALQHSVDAVEATAFRLALEGEPSIITFLLRCHRPEVYRERQEVAVAGGIVFLPQKKEGAE
jgi:hypothetical protein